MGREAQLRCWDPGAETQAEGGGLENSQAVPSATTLRSPEEAQGRACALPGVVWRPEAELEAGGRP